MISESRGWMISQRARRGRTRGVRSPTLNTSINSPSAAMCGEAAPARTFSFSASLIGVRRPTAMSLVMCVPPTGRMALWMRPPPTKPPMLVLPPPISATTVPSSRSAGERIASAEASGSSTNSPTSRPASWTHFTTLARTGARPARGGGGGAGDDAAAVGGGDVLAGDGHEGGGEAGPGHALGALDGVLDGFDGGVQVDDDAFAQA